MRDNFKPQNNLMGFGNHDTFDRELFFLSLKSLEDLPPKLSLPTPNFVFFLACNARKLSAELIHDFAGKIVASGAAYFCIWGADCERVHDIFDELLAIRDVDEQKIYPHVPTTWHSKEDLDEALWFALNVTSCDDGYADSCGSTLVVSVANEEWDFQIQSWLSNVSEFNKSVLSKGDA